MSAGYSMIILILLTDDKQYFHYFFFFLVFLEQYILQCSSIIFFYKIRGVIYTVQLLPLRPLTLQILHDLNQQLLRRWSNVICIKDIFPTTLKNTPITCSWFLYITSITQLNNDDQNVELNRAFEFSLLSSLILRIFFFFFLAYILKRFPSDSDSTYGTIIFFHH